MSSTLPAAFVFKVGKAIIMRLILGFILLIHIFLFNSSPLFAQTTLKADKSQPIALKENLQATNSLRLGLHIVPSTLLNSNNRLRMGVQVTASRWAAGLDVSYGASWMPNAWSVGKNTGLEGYLFYGIRPEVRYYFTDVSDLRYQQPFYLGLEAAFTYFERIERDKGFDIGVQEFFYESATMQRIRHSVFLKAGRVFNINEKFYLDVYYGLGAAYRQYSYTDIVGLVEIMNRFNREELFGAPSRSVEPKWVLDLALGFRFGIYL